MPDNAQAPSGSDRSHAEVTDDISITAAVRSVLMWSQWANGINADVETTRGTVILSGTADSAATKNLASLLAANTHGVCAVDNRLEILPLRRESF